MSYGLTTIWLGCGFIFYGLMFAWVQADFPELAKQHYWLDRVFFLATGLIGGPIALAVAALCVGMDWLICGRWRGFKLV